MQFKEFYESGNNTKNRTLIVTDIQPEYEKYFTFDMSRFCRWLNKSKYENIIILYNGKDTLGMISEEDLRIWYEENGFDIENQYVTFYDKGYAFFRYCIDEGIYEDDIVTLVKYMMEKGINDSRDLSEEWDEFVQTHKLDHIRELLEFSGDMVNIPELIDFLKEYNNIDLVGGGVNECLKEVEIALKAMNKKYKTIDDWVY
jgi:hypothetical protein